MPSPLIDRISIELGAQEPWPKDVKLFQPYEVEQILLPDNANCLAVQAFLKMCNLEFQVEPRANAEDMSPTGKVPFIKVGRFVTAELEGIVQFVNGKDISLTDKLDNEQKSDLRAYMSLIKNVIEVAELYYCWNDRETYNEVTSVRNGSVYPWPLNHIKNIEKKHQVVKKLKVLDWYHKTIEEVHQEVQSCCEALNVRLDNKPYFFAEGPTELDALVFGHLFTILTTPLTRKDLAKIVRRIFNLDEKFDIDAKELHMQYRRLQAQLHPDKFTQKTAEEKEISESFSSLVNKAYNNLQFPLKRAEHLLELRGDQLNEKENAVDDPEFLMEMMELNEELENTTNVEKLKALNIKNRTQLEIITKNIDECFKENDLKQAKYFVIKMKYYTSLGNRINAILRELGIVD
ncbi:hypothetical protein YQE_02340, partial [Dendroctonus ponderosae]